MCMSCVCHVTGNVSDIRNHCMELQQCCCCYHSVHFVAVVQIQLTDFENAAYAVFIVLLTRTILSFGLNFLIPISKVG